MVLGCTKNLRDTYNTLFLRVVCRARNALKEHTRKHIHIHTVTVRGFLIYFLVLNNGLYMFKSYDTVHIEISKNYMSYVSVSCHVE